MRNYGNASSRVQVPHVKIYQSNPDRRILTWANPFQILTQRQAQNQPGAPTPLALPKAPINEERSLNLRDLIYLLVFGSLLMMLAGCASSPRSGQGAETVDAASSAVPDPNKPRMFFNGGNVQQVRGTAMGAATSQGWKIQESPGDSLILQRQLDSMAAEALAPGSSRGPLPPVVEVRADFFPRGGGVETQLGAEVITLRGTDREVRQDYTDAYRNELTHSLAVLQNAWHEAGPRIANALPPIGGFQSQSAAENQLNSTSSDVTQPVDLVGPQGDEEVETESANQALADTKDEQVPYSSAADWTLPAAAAATAAATARARAEALSPAPTFGGPAPVVNRSPSSRIPATQTQGIAPPTAPLTGVVVSSPSLTPAKVAGTSSGAGKPGVKLVTPAPASAKGANTAVTAGQTITKAGTSSPKVSVSPTKAKPASSGSTAASAPAPASVISKSPPTVATRKAPPMASKTSPSSANSAPPVAKAKTAATATPPPKRTNTLATANSAGKTPGKSAPIAKSQQPATTSAKTASATGSKSVGTTTSKVAATPSKANTPSKTAKSTAGAKKGTTTKEN
jgi:hypothetical protein